MGIELPAELAEVAARAGVTWPKADEDALRSSAVAWREAGAKLGTLAGESDGAAGKALSAMTGEAGDAARRHWNTFTAPDGRLNAAVRGCTTAADRLDHAAQQVGAAKVELVRELVKLAKNTDAANQAASAGNPDALLGLDTALQGAVANVSHLTNTLTNAIRLDTGVQIGGPLPVDTNPGVHAPAGAPPNVGGLLGDVGGLLGGGQDGGTPAGEGDQGAGQGDPGQGDSGQGGQGGGLLGTVLGGGQSEGGQSEGGQSEGGLVGGLVDAVVQPVAGIVDPVVGVVDDVVGGAVDTVTDTVTDTVDRTADTVTDTVDRAVHGGLDNLPGRGPDGGHGHGVAPGNGPAGGPGPDRGPGPVGQVTAPLTGGNPIGGNLPGGILPGGNVHGGILPGGAPMGLGPVVDPVVRAADTVTSSSAAVLERPVLPVDAHAPAPQPAAPAANTPQAPGFGGPGGVSSGPVGGAAGGAVAGAPTAAGPVGAAQSSTTHSPAAQSQAAQSHTAQSPASQQGQAAGQSQQSGNQRADQRGPVPTKDGGHLPGQAGSGQAGSGQTGSGQTGSGQSGQGNQAGQAKDAGQPTQTKDAVAAKDIATKDIAAKDAAQAAKDAAAKSRDDAAMGFAVLPLSTGGRDTVVRGGQGFPPGTVPGQGFPDPGTVTGGRGFPPGTGFGSMSGTLGSGVLGSGLLGSGLLGSGLLGSGQGSAIVPTEVVATQRAGQGAQPSDESVALFFLHMFPGGALPPARSAPARQLPAPPEEQDFAPGLRFEPQGHPDGHLVDASARHRPRVVHGPGGVPDVALTGGYDPQAGMHERDWDRRFLVRLDPPEYAWPPAELFPEGGYEAGQPGMLAAGVELDRFGGPEGRVLAEAGTSFTSRSLPPAALDAGYHRYRVARDLPVWFTLSAEWFGQEGGGVRYRTTYPVAELVALGYLEEVR
ncbi:TNT domain-containing protein [Actinosynnema sp. NPDC023587]|uniref:TNT domain-containing protein n=1 Tax=Actinosynnema sp. NPDC023587 TaxID=3154695 RepID=UPI0033E7E60E